MAKLILEKILKRKGISKYAFAKLTNMDKTHVYRWFRKGYDPKLSTLVRWAKALGCKVKDLIDE